MSCCLARSFATLAYASCLPLLLACSLPLPEETTLDFGQAEGL